ncbi:hypothetical protein JCM10908_007191 [Rhodotorula pacifica]|uniref:uncharacterized protein n=1 Tax=Rhodotorula pacifica TaxID=1495444 RepID=UPI00317C4A4A
MTQPPKLHSATQSVSTTVVLSWTIDLCMAELPANGSCQFPLTGTSLPGDWSLTITKASHGSEITIEILYGSLSQGELGKDVNINIALESSSTSLYTQRFHEAEVPTQNSNKPGTLHTGWFIIYNPNVPETWGWKYPSELAKRVARCSVNCEVHGILNIKESPASRAEDARIISRLASTNLSPTPHDLCLAFARPDGTKLELWTSTTLLCAISPYFQTMIASGYAEAAPRRSRRSQQRIHELANAPKQEPETDLVPEQAKTELEDWADSDSEGDDYLVKRKLVAGAGSSDLHFDFYYVPVKETAFSTYRAVLSWMQTGYIRFAPLGSAFGPTDRAAITSRKTALCTWHTSEYGALMPLPVSPKSVFRLAHLLQLSDLQKLALETFTANLTIAGAALELFSPPSIAYDEVRAPVLAFVLKNWDKVKVTQAWNECKAKSMRGEIEGSSQVLGEVMDGLL